MTKVFISYSRKDKAIAEKINNAINEIDLDSWIDWNDIPPTADWWEQIQKGIETSDVCLFLLSPDFVVSDICKQETEHAFQNGKRMIPLIVSDVKTDDVYPTLTKLNWIFFRPQDNFADSMQKLEVGIRTDLQWVETHRRLQVRALEWEKRKDNSSLLLRGKDLQDAESQLAASSSKDPAPTDLQREYVLEGRLSADRQRRIVTAISIVGGLVMTALAIFGFVQANLATTQAAIAQTQEARANLNAAVAQTAQADAETERANAERQAEKVLAGNLAAQGNSVQAKDHALALLLGAESSRREDTFLTRTSLFQSLQFSPYTRVFGYSGPIVSIATSPNGKLFAVSSGNKISLVDIQTTQTLFTISGAEMLNGLGVINSLAFNHDGSLLVAGGCIPEGCETLGQLTVWDVRDPKLPVQLSDIRRGHNAQIKAVAFSPDGKYIATGSYDRNVIIWDAATPDKIRALGNPLKDPKSNGLVTALAFSPDGATLVAASDDVSIRLWNVSTPQVASVIQTLPAQHTDSIYSIAFSPQDSKKFASASDDNTVVLWDWDAGAKTITNPLKLAGHSGFVRSVAFNDDGNVLASASFDRTVILWNAQTGERIGLPLDVHTKALNVVVFAAADSKNILISGSGDRTVVLWDLSTRQPLSQPLKETTIPEDLGKTAQSGTTKATVDEQHIKLSDRDSVLSGHTGVVNTLSFSPQKIDDKLLLASASDDQTVILWDVTDVANSTVYLKLEDFESPVIAAFFSADAKHLTTVEKNGNVVKWSIDPANWFNLACAGALRNLTPAEWEHYLAGQPYAKTCEAYP